METTLHKQSSFQLPVKTKEIFIDATCYALIILFLYTATSKLCIYKSWEAGLHAAVLLKSYSQILAWLIPGLEIIFSIFLIIPKIRRYGLIGSSLLLVTFTIYLIYMVSYGGPKACGCGGVLQSLSWNQHIVFNIFFILISGISLFFTKALRTKQSA